MTAVAEALSTLLPPDALDPEGVEAPGPGRPPEAVVRPSTTDEVATVMAWATREGVGVLPLAAGRRARPVSGEGRWVALSTTRLSGVQEYEAANLTLTAGAGTPFSAVTAALAENRQWAPFDPPHAPERSVGGLVAAADPGPLRMGYGDVRHHVLGMTVVTGDGRILGLGGRVVKNVAGYDVLKAVVGSRGTLAVVTSVCLRAFPRPQVDRVLILEGASVEELLEPALEVGTAPVLPVSCVIVDALEVDAGAAGPSTGRGAGPALVVRLHGAAETVDDDQRRLEEHVGASFATVGDGAVDDRARDVLDAVRDRAADHPVVIQASAVPSRLGDLLSALSALDAEALVVDSYGGIVRLGASGTEAERVADVRRRIEAVGGAMRLTSALPALDTWDGTTPPTDGERALVDRLREAFDPGGALWPARP